MLEPINFTVRIITGRDDGGWILVEQQEDGRLKLIMKSNTGAIITSDTIPAAEFAQWIHNHHDW